MAGEEAMSMQFALLGESGVGKTRKYNDAWQPIQDTQMRYKTVKIASHTSYVLVHKNYLVSRTHSVKMYIGGSSHHPVMTINPACERKEISVVHLGRPDTAGMERFQPLMPQYYRSTHGFIIVYDVTSRDSFEALDRVFVDAETFATVDDHVKIVVGNKIDKVKERVVSRAEGLKYAFSKSALFIEASARTNEAVDHIFEKLTVKILEDSNLWRKVPSENIHLHASPTTPAAQWRCWC